MGWPAFLSIGLVALLSWPLSQVDIKEHRLPNPMTLTIIGAAVLLVSLDAILLGSLSALIWALACAGFTFGVGFAMAHWNLIGMGDVKLLTGLHLILGYLSPWLILLSLTAGFLAASLVSLPRLLMGKITANSNTAMGPHLLLGFFLVVIFWITGVV